MTDKEKFRKEVEKLKSSLIHGACSSQIAMETRCKEEAYNEVLAILDSLQEEPVSKDYRKRYKRIAESEEFRKNYDGMSIGDIVPVEEQEPASEDLEKIVEEIAEPTILNAYGTKELARRLRNTICGISISEDLGEYINELSKQFPEVSFAKLSRIAVRVAKWQKEKLWKPADGNDLPEIDREVIVLTQPYPLGGNEYAVYFAHRPNLDGWDGKSVTTGKVEHYTPELYDKGGWNIPDVKWWLDCSMPKETEL